MAIRLQHRPFTQKFCSLDWKIRLQMRKEIRIDGQKIRIVHSIKLQLRSKFPSLFISVKSRVHMRKIHSQKLSNIQA